MANINFAGAFDPSAASKFGWNKAAFSNATPFVNAPGIGTAPIPTENTLDAYAKTWNQQRDALLKGMGKDDTGLATALAFSSLGTSPTQLQLQSQLRKQEAEDARKMRLEDLKYLNQLAIEKQGRDFTFSQLANLPRSIAGAFSPMPWEATQQVVGNIANITGAQNIRPVTLPQAAGVALPTRSYFS